MPLSTEDVSSGRKWLVLMLNTMTALIERQLCDSDT